MRIRSYARRTRILRSDSVVTVTTMPLSFETPGGTEMLILGFAVLLFGANKLSALARPSQQAFGEFENGRQELEDEIRAAAGPAEDAATSDTESATRTSCPVSIRLH